MIDGHQQERGGKFARTAFGPEHRAVARAIFESRPGVTTAEIAEELGAKPSTIRRWKSEAAKAAQPWRAASHMPPDLSGRASRLASTFKSRVSDLGHALDDERVTRALEMECSELNAVEIRAEVLSRHRREWAAPRKLAYEAIQMAGADAKGACERAKLAKIMAETLTLVQAGECRAFGLDVASRGVEGGLVVVVERMN